MVARLAILLLLLCTVSSCIPVIPGSVFPFYPPGDKGVELPTLVGKWTGASGETLSVAPDVAAGNPGDYVFRVTSPPLPAQPGEAQVISTPQDFVFYAHAFEVADEVYIDISLTPPQQGRGDGPPPESNQHNAYENAEPGVRAAGKQQQHMLLRYGQGAGSISLQMMDADWLGKYLAQKQGTDREVHMFPGGDPASRSAGGDPTQLPQLLFEDSASKVWDFINKHADDGLWGMEVDFARAE